MKRLVVLSHGMGQDSGGILSLLTDPARPDLRERYIGDADLLVAHCDTGDEHGETVAYRAWVRSYCEAAGIDYLQINLGDGHHTGTWALGLLGHFEATSTIGSVAYPSTCSDRLKIQPLWNGVNAYCARRFDVSAARKNGLYEHARRFGKVDVLIGFGKGEERRVIGDAQLALAFDGDESEPGAPWFVRNVRRVYPLIDLGMGRAEVQMYLRGRNQPVPRPSNCRACHWKSPQELLHLALTEPDFFQRWCDLEDAKRAAWEGRTDRDGRPTPNHGVKGKQSLREFYSDAVARFGHLTRAELDEYVMSHGHCVMSKY